MDALLIARDADAQRASRRAALDKRLLHSFFKKISDVHFLISMPRQIIFPQLYLL